MSENKIFTQPIVFFIQRTRRKRREFAEISKPVLNLVETIDVKFTVRGGGGDKIGQQGSIIHLHFSLHLGQKLIFLAVLRKVVRLTLALLSETSELSDPHFYRDAGSTTRKSRSANFSFMICNFIHGVIKSRLNGFETK